MWLALAILAGAWGPSEPMDADRLEALVEQARSGCSQAAGDVYTALARRVYRSVRPLCQSSAETEDLVQDTFVRAFGSLHRYRARPGKGFTAWLMTLAFNLARQRRSRDGNRRRLSERRLVEPEASDGSLSPEALAQRAEGRERLLSALESLSDRDREIVCLRYGAELEAVEVGELCNTSAANVRKVCERQRQRLVLCLQASAPGAAGLVDNVREDMHER